jgi:N-acetylglucosaminyldiphosphoundecaprenol N-acetyl-beta-D-mannosaminyltransferase
MKTDSTIPGPLDRKTNTLLIWGRVWFEHAALLALEVLPRTFDIVLSLALIIVLSPAILVRALVASAKSGMVFSTVELIGRFRMPFRQLHFGGNAFGGGLAVLFNILKGDMAFAGPRPMSEDEVLRLTPEQCIRFTLRPGLFSPFGLRRKVGIAYDSETVSDIDFYYSETVQGDMGLVARSLIGDLLAGGGLRPTPPILHFFGIDITNTTMDEAVDWMVKRVRNSATAFVAFVNPDCLNIAYGHEKYRQVLSHATRVLPDGIGINLGCRMMGVSLLANVNGTDLFPRLCERAAAEGVSLFLLGAKPGVAETVSRKMQERFPGLAIAGVQDGYFKPEETERVIEEINQSQANILLVAFGAPKQEQWLAEHHDKLKPWVRVGVGGLFDFYSGRFPRAPIWMREIGLEWTWRLLQEPGRMWRRYLIGNPLFLYRVWLQKKDKENQR